MVKKGDSSDFEHNMVVAARWAEILAYSHLRFTEIGAKKKKK